MSCCRKYSMRVPLNFPAREPQRLAGIRFTRPGDLDKWASAQKLGLTVRAGEARKLPFGGAAHAQEWPTRSVTMVIPFAAGGPQDGIGRIVAQRMSEVLGQQVIVENVTGAGGMTGSDRVAKAEPDGYQFVLGSVGTHAQNQTLYKRPAYNAATDFAPV